MSTVYVLGNPPYIYVPNQYGQPNAGGFFRTLDTVTGAPKAVYVDQAGEFPAPNPVPLGLNGITETPIYFQVTTGEDLYTLDILDANGNLLYSIPNYPDETSGGGDIIVNNNVVNYARNEQFAFWNFGISFDNTTLPIGTTQIADDWYYTRSNTDATITIQQYNFAAGANLFPFSPTSALQFIVTISAPDSTSYISQFYESVQTLTNQVATYSFYAMTTNVGGSAPLNLILIQNFGTGGSSPIVTVIDTYTVTDTATQFSSTFTLPDIGGNTIGTGSNIQFIIQSDTDVIQNIVIGNAAFQSGTGSGTAYPYISENEQYVKILPDILLGNEPSTGTDIIGVGSLLNPPIPNETLTEYLGYTNALSNSNEFLIGWFFPTNPNQFGAVISSVNNGQYVADQTIVVSDGNGVVSKDSFIGNELSLTIVIPNTKFGIFQIIESASSLVINSSNVSLGAQLSITSGTTTFKMAIIGWSGITGMETKQCVAAWNAPGTDPSLATNWSYASTIQSFTVTSPSLVITSLNNQIPSAYITYGVLIWNDSADMLTGTSIDFLQASLSFGLIARDNNGQDFGNVLRQCQRYYYRTYDWQIEQAVGAITGNGQNAISIPNMIDSTGNNGFIYPISIPSGFNANVVLSQFNGWVTFIQTMYRAPTVSIYDPETGAAGFGSAFIPETSMTLVGPTLNIPITENGSSETGFNLYSTYTSVAYIASAGGMFNSYPIVYYHYVADATLGV
jgi:hypothetical protein